MNFMTGIHGPAHDQQRIPQPQAQLAPLGVVSDISGSSARILIDIEAMETMSQQTDPAIAMAGQVGSQVKMRVGKSWIIANVRTLAIDGRTSRQIVANI
ncbi:MAG TPA: ATPase, partial [Candidatus Polarisedimenticolia bacterium]|nr:ATPase [Candidatus Polarisedimenticolia bacterium]